jgi:hypothetical protein
MGQWLYIFLYTNFIITQLNRNCSQLFKIKLLRDKEFVPSHTSCQQIWNLELGMFQAKCSTCSLLLQARDELLDRVVEVEDTFS